MPLTTKATLEARINNALSASAPATHWLAANLDEALTSAIEEYTRARPYHVNFTQGPISAREVALSPVLSLIQVERIWFPFTVATPEYPPSWVEYDFWFDSVGVPMVRLHTDSIPDGAHNMRVWHSAPHTLNGLNSATTTTWPNSEDSVIVVGACGYACLQRSTELDETLANMAISTPNYGALAELYFQRFHDMLYTYASRGTQL